MRILHTADWHLGHRLYDRDRTPEHRAALTWLLDVIEEEKVDLLIVAGDIFDVTNPSNQARELYYEFLGQLAKTKCAGAVIVGGNHDSPSMLDAPKEVLRSLNLHIVGAARTQVQDEVIEIAGWGDTEARLLVAAVPYLRERDIRRAKSGETSEERLSGLQEGIRNHYQEVAAAAEAKRENPETPIIATGHLFAGGASDHDEKKSYIYQADEHNIEGGQFPAMFDYVALGHIHRAQRVGGQEHIRYSGSIVPLTFVEGERVRSVRIVDIATAGQPVQSRQVDVPYFRQLLRLNDDLESIKQSLRNAAVAYTANPVGLKPWAEIRVKTDERLTNLRQTLLDTIKEVTPEDFNANPVELLRISQERLTPAPAAAPAEKRQLDELEPEEVFRSILDREGMPAERVTELLTDFTTLRNWMNEQPV